MEKVKYVYLCVNPEFIEYDRFSDVDTILNPNFANVYDSKIDLLKEICSDVYFEDEQKWRSILEIFKSFYDVIIDEDFEVESDELEIKNNFKIALKEFKNYIK